MVMPPTYVAESVCGRGSISAAFFDLNVNQVDSFSECFTNGWNGVSPVMHTSSLFMSARF